MNAVRKVKYINIIATYMRVSIYSLTNVHSHTHTYTHTYTHTHIHTLADLSKQSDRFHRSQR